MYQSASKPALLCRINLLVIDSKPAPSPEMICFKTSVTASRSLSTGSGDSGALSVAWLKLNRGVRKKLCAFVEEETNKQTKNLSKTLYLYWMVLLKLQSWSSRTVWSDRNNAQIVSSCITTYYNNGCLLDYFEE